MINTTMTMFGVMLGIVMLGVAVFFTASEYASWLNPNWKVVEVLMLIGKILSLIGVLGMVTCLIILSSK